MKKAIYPGTFDPITYGHIDIVNRAVKVFNPVILAVADNSGETVLSVDDRVQLARQSLSGMDNVQVVSFGGLLADFARREKAEFLIRGLRVVSDFDYECQMAVMNRLLNSELETVFFTAAEKYQYLSSSLVRQVATHGGDMSEFVPDTVSRHLQRLTGSKSSAS